MRPSSAGCTARVFTCSATGAMMNIVRNSVRPIRIWFDGISCVPSACRRKWKTITMRVKHVMITSAAGTNDSSVRTTTSCSGAEMPPMPSMFTFS